MATKRYSRAKLTPTPNQTFEIVGGDSRYNFIRSLRESLELQNAGRIQEACQARLDAVQLIEELLPEDEEINLEWEHSNSRAALEIIHSSAVDHFLIGDYELSAAMLELALDLDPEDHLEAVNLLGFNYIKLGEYELFDEIVNDISDKSACRQIMMLWYHYRRTQKIDAGTVQHLKRSFKSYYEEFTSEEHPSDDNYLKDIESQSPSQSAQARELWLKTESLWADEPQFITLLKESK